MMVLTSLFLTALAPSASAHETAYSTSGLTDGAVLATLLDDLAATDTDIDELVVLPDGAWLVAADGSIEVSSDFPALAGAYAEWFAWYGHRIEALAVAADDPDTFVLVTDQVRHVLGDPVSEAVLTAQLDAAMGRGDQIDELLLLPDASGWALTTGGQTTVAGMPADYTAAIAEQSRTGQAMQAGSLHDADRWLVVEGQWFDGDGLDDALFDQLTTRQRTADRLDHVQLGPAGSWVVYSEGSASTGGTWQRLEYDPGRGTIWQRMADIELPGVSIAIIEDGVLVGARAYGLRQRGTQDVVRTTTPFYQASISKYLTALGAQRLVDDPTTGLTLDTSIADISADYRWGEVDYWLSYAPWMRVTGDYHLVPFDEDEVTLQRLLNHHASLRSSGYYTFSNGNFPAWPADPRAGDWLLGLGLDGFSGRPVWSSCAQQYNFVWRDVTYEGLLSCSAPGTADDYSNEGFQVVAAIIEDVSGQAFSDHMDDAVFGPLGMEETWASAPFPAELRAQASRAHDDNGVKAWMDSGFAAAGAMRGTPWSYAHALFPLLDEGRDRWGRPFLSQDRVDELLLNGSAGVSYGLGLALESVQPDGSGGVFRHGGVIPGRVHTTMIGSPSEGDAIVIMINAGNDADDDNSQTVENESYGDFIVELRDMWRTDQGW